MKHFFKLLIFLLVSSNLAVGQGNVITGAERMQVYLPLLKDKKVAVFANPTSIVGQTHLVDT